MKKLLLTLLAAFIWVGIPANAQDPIASSVDNEVRIVFDYLKVFPYTIGSYDAEPNTVIAQLNKQEKFGYDSWRVPTKEELSLLIANGFSIDSNYMSKENPQGIVLLVTEDYSVEEKRLAADNSARAAAKLLLSKSSVTHDNEEGDYKLSFAIESPYPGMDVTVSKDVDWITNVDVVGDSNQLVYSLVANNDPTPRTTSLTLTYGSKQYDVTITQTGKTKGTHNGYEWVDLGLSIKWATHNVGASSPEGCGGCYVWGDVYGKVYKLDTDGPTWRKSIGDIKGTSLDVAYVKWGGNWRMPTSSDWEELICHCTWTWTRQNGRDGYMVTSKKNGSSIFLPVTGYCSGYEHAQGDIGYYWSSSPNWGDNRFAYAMIFYWKSVGVSQEFRAYRLHVRPVLD